MLTRSLSPKIVIECLFGGSPLQTTWFVTLFSMCFFWGFALKADLSEITTFTGALRTATGSVVETKATGFKSGGSTVFRLDYKFSWDTAKYEGHSFGYSPVPGVGDPVIVEFPENDPSNSRIQGMRPKPFPPAVILVALFPLGAVGTLLFFIKERRKALKLLKSGQLTKAKLVSKDSTNMQVNNRPVFKMTFSFQAADGRMYEAKTSTSLTANLEDENSGESILYNRVNPAENILLDKLPGKIKVSQDGSVRGQGGKLGLLILPAATCLIHGSIFLKLILPN